MSLTLNMVGGGSGGGISPNAAVLAVTTFIGASVTITNGSTSKTKDATKAHVIDTDNDRAVYIFSIGQSQFGTWSVAVTCDGITQTKTIAITAVEFYEITVRARVPDDYQEVEYLSITNAGPIIDPNIVAGDSWLSGSRVVEVGYMSTGTELSDLFGGFAGNSSSTYNRFYIGFRPNGTNIYYGFGNDSAGDIWANTSIASNVQYEVKFVSNNLSVSVYHKNIGTGISTLLSTKTLSRQPNSATKFVLFGDHNTSNNQYSTGSNCRIYYCRFYKDDVIIHDLIPCYRKSDSVKGMFDRITNTFYTNANTGSFSVGGDVN